MAESVTSVFGGHKHDRIKWKHLYQRPKTPTNPHPGLSQTLAEVARRTVPTPILRLVGRRQSEVDRQQSVLLAYRPGTCKAEMGWTPSAPVKPGRYDTGHRHRRGMSCP